MLRYSSRTLIWLAIVVATCAAGCRREASNAKWEAAQQRSQEQSAQQSSSDRMGSADAQTAPDVIPKSSATADELGPPPAFNPGGISTSGPVTWSPSGSAQNKQTPADIDLEALQSGDPVDGSQLNRYFPAQEAGEDRVAKQEKKGFAQYSFRRDGVEVAQLSITDLRGNPAAAEKFLEPDMRIGNYPATRDGSLGTTLLVGGRFQVKVRSPGGQLNEAERTAMLQRFDLAKLEQLAP